VTATTQPADRSLGMRDIGAIPRAALRLLDRSLAGRWWLLVATAMATVVSLFFAFPTYDNFDSHSKDWVAIQKIADHPFDQDGLINTDRAYNFTFRVFVPLVGGRLGLGPQGYMVIQGLAGVAMFAAAAHIVNRLTGRRRLGALIAMTVGLMWAGACSFVELRGDFDAVAIALLAAAMATRRWYLVTLCCFLAAWTDERAIPAIAFVMLFHAVVESRDLGPLKALRDPRVLGALGGVVLHFVTRLGASAVFDLHQPSNLGTQYVKDQVNILPVGAWTGLEGLWVFVLLGAVVLFMARQWVLALAYLGLIGLVAVASIAVVDVTRSMAYLLPAGFVGIAVAARFCQPRLVRHAVYLAFGLSIAWPLYYAGGASTVYWAYPLPLVLVRNLAGVSGGSVGG